MCQSVCVCAQLSVYVCMKYPTKWMCIKSINKQNCYWNNSVVFSWMWLRCFFIIICVFLGKRTLKAESKSFLNNNKSHVAFAWFATVTEQYAKYISVLECLTFSLFIFRQNKGKKNQAQIVRTQKMVWIMIRYFLHILCTNQHGNHNSQPKECKQNIVWF